MKRILSSAKSALLVLSPVAFGLLAAGLLLSDFSTTTTSVVGNSNPVPIYAAAPESIAGSTVTVASGGMITAGMSSTVGFQLNAVSPDDEYSTQVTLTAPAGWVLTRNAEDASSGTGNHTVSAVGSGTNSITYTITATTGTAFPGVRNGQSWGIDVDVTAPMGTSGAVNVGYTINGDGFGANPHTVSGNTSLTVDPGVDPNEIAVTIFHDYNSNGSNDGPGETGIPGLTVTAYDAANAPTVLNDDGDGNYSFMPGNANVYRLEVTGIPAGLEPSVAGATTVFFMDRGNIVPVGLHYPAEHYLDNGVHLAIPCYVDGANNGANAGEDVLIITPVDDLAAGDGNITPTEYFIADHDEIGSTFGITYSRAANSVFAAAFTKRHTAFGPAGTGAIYKVDLNGDEITPPVSSTGISTLVDLNALFGANTTGANPHPNAADFDRDPGTYDRVGKMGLGGLTMSETENTLWTINLADRRLYEIPLGGTFENPTPPAMGDINIWPAVGDLTGLPGLVGADLGTNIRPFAVKCHRGKIYVGLVYTAESTVVFNPATSVVSNLGDRSQMRGYVYEFDPITSGFTQLLSFPFDYVRGQAADFCGNNGQAEFNPWTPVYDATAFEAAVMGSSRTSPGIPAERVYPQPWITDIAFDENDKMIIGIRDRFADQHGFNKLPPNSGATNDPGTRFTADGAGDVLVASINTIDNTTYVLENNAQNGTNGAPFGPSTGAGFQEGPGGGEFFFDDRYRPVNASADGDPNAPCGEAAADDEDPLLDPGRQQGHDEITLGGLFTYFGQQDLYTGAYGPINNFNNFNNAGILSMNTITGARTGASQIYASTVAGGVTFAKGNGLGDVEGLNPPAPLQVGNRLWLDANNNGRQDANEAGVNGVLVELFKANNLGIFTKVAETNTMADAVQGDGFFVFSNDDDANQTWVDGTEVLPEMDYEVRVSLLAVQGVNASVSAFTVPNANGDATNNRKTDLNDSDASALGVVAFSTGREGENNHTLDIGVSELVMCAITVNSASPSACVPATNQYTLDVEVTYSNAPVGEMIEITTSNGAIQSFTPAGAAGTETFTLTGLTSDGTADIDVMATFATTMTCTDNLADAYTAPADCTPLCMITVNSASPSACVPATNQYTLDVEVTYSTAPAGEMIEITTSNGAIQSFTPAGAAGTETFTLTGLTSDGTADVDVMATFATTTTCTDELANAYTAPADCTPECDIAITNISVICSDDTDFTVSFDVSWENVNATSDMIEVSIDGDAQPLFTPLAMAGTTSFGPISVSGPAYDIIVDAIFLVNTGCATVAPIDLIACTEMCIDDLGGNVFNDYNNDGVDAGNDEVGQENVLVEIYECGSDVPVATTYTNANGGWSVDDTGITYPVRVEFSTPLQDYLQSSIAGTDNGTNTQMVDAATCLVNYGVVDPAIYCANDPDFPTRLLIPCYVNGNAAAQTGSEVLVDILYTAMGKRALADGSTVGAVWGVAYSPVTKKAYTSAVLKRHTGLGTNGLGGIYEIDYSTPTPSVSAFSTLPDVGSNPRSMVLPASPSTPSTDGGAFASVGEVGVGDIEISHDGSILYLVNLARKRVDVFDVVSKTVTGSLPIPNPGCGTGTYRPWALKIDKGTIYAGVVCDDASRAFVYKLINGSFQLIDLDTSDPTESGYLLNYTREGTWGNNFSASTTCSPGDQGPEANQWNAWIDNFPAATCVNPFGDGVDYLMYPQPILADLEIDDTGSFILGFSDRMGLQGGFENFNTAGSGRITTIASGDVRRICNTSTGLVPEGKAGCAQNDSGDGDVPGPEPTFPTYDDGAEFYGGEDWVQNVTGNVEHFETAIGGLTYRFGTGEVVSVVYDPIDGSANAGGFKWLSNTTGQALSRFELYNAASTGTFAKAVGLGDVELICPELPTQIGNYVWQESDTPDGIQQACEDPIVGLPVSLYTKDDNGDLTLVATTMTNVDGEYYFTSDGTAGETWINGGDAIISDTTYLIVFGDTPLTDETFTFNGVEYALTQDSTGEGNNPGLNDSDGLFTDVTIGGMTQRLPAICYSTADTTDHTLDVGLIPVDPILAALGNYVWLDENSDGLQDAGEPGIPNVLVVLNDMDGTPIDSTLTASDGRYLFPDLEPAMYFVDVVETTLPDTDGNPGTQDLTQTTIFTNVLDGADADTDEDDGDLGNKDHSGDGYKITLDPGEENLTGDFGYNYAPTDDVNRPMGSPLGALGDRVWFDADRDGQQDPEEVGAEGVTLKLIAVSAVTVDGTAYAAGDEIATDVTDANGYYIFDGLPAGAYNVMVADDANGTGGGGPLNGFEQTGDPDHFATSEADNPDDAAEDDNMTTYPVVLGPGDVFLNVDFGYDDDNDLGAIGDYVWFDADADGNGPNNAGATGTPVNQGDSTEDDADEQPIPGVSVALIQDTNGDGKWDEGEPIIGTDVTDENGLYFFPGLPAGNGEDYLVFVTDNDNVLDGLRPTYDADGGAMEVADRYPRSQMSNMELGLSAVANLIAGAGNEVLNQDFGYAPVDHEEGDGLIGDYVWYDTNEDGVQDADEPGIENVKMELYDLGADEAVGGGDDALIATTTTDENGYYLFGNLPVDADGEGYQVRVGDSGDCDNFAAGAPLEDLINTYDPDDLTTNPDDMGGAVVLTTADPVDLDQDFGYVADDDGGNNVLGSIGNQVWEDVDADGVYEPNGFDGLPGTSDDETPIEGVTIDLYRDLDGNGELDPGEPRIGTQTTDVNGNYLFDELPLDDYIVNVTDVDDVLVGYWHSTGGQDATTNAGDDAMDNSKEDAFAVTIDNTIPDNLNVDFGYYKDPAALGNYVWIDADRNGLQNDGETGINGVGVMMLITYEDGTEIMLSDTTRNDQDGNAGFYDFRNLLLDEDYRDTLSPQEPSFVISVDGNQQAFTDLNLVPTIADIGGNADDSEDSDNFNGVRARPVQGSLNTEARDPETTEEPIATYDFGAVEEPTLCDTGDGCSYLADFETDDMGNPLVAGMSNIFVDQPYANLYGAGQGLRFSTNDQANHPLNLYNTDGTGGLDADLERNGAGTNQWANGNIITEMLGNVLIINQTTDITQPNDFAGGGDLIVNSDRPLGRFAFDLIDLEPVNVGNVTFSDTRTGSSVTISFSDFEAGSGSAYEVPGVVFGDRTANRIISVDADALGLVSFDSITFNLPSQSGAIGVICATVNQKFDLALVKRLDSLATPAPFEPGDLVTFEVEVYNQGQEGVGNVEVKDYIPTGLTLAAASAADWTVTADTATLTTPIDTIPPGDSATVNISFMIDIDFMDTTLVNNAEISYFDDDDDVTTDPPLDEDSTPNNNGDTDPELLTDDDVDDDGVGTPGLVDNPADEDDFDPVLVRVIQTFDLALIKQIDTQATPGPFTYGSTVTYAIEVRNQGSLDATDVEVADYIPDGLTLVPSGTWTQDVDTARLVTPFDLAAGDTTTLSISFTIDLDFTGEGIVNTAEITAGSNRLGFLDEDSRPGDNGGDDPEFDTDDEDDDDGLNGNGNADNPDDSDDFDLARLSIETVSLGSTVFLDNNNDGLQNGADTGIANVVIQLFDAATEMQILTDATGARVTDPVDAAVVVTDTDGNYHFTNLIPGDYYVVIPNAPNEAPISSNNSGIAFAETDPDDNRDNDDEGLQTGGSGTAVSSDTISLSLGDEPVNGTGMMDESAQGNMQDDAFDSNGNMSLDFGFFAPVSVGDTAFVDLDNSGTQSLGDAPLEGVTVVLLDPATGDTITIDAEGNPITGITMTAADGSYSFPNLPPGSYQVFFDISTTDDPEFYAFVTPDQGGNDALDSDAIAVTDSTGLSTPTAFLPSGTDDPTLDVGVRCITAVTVADEATICSTQQIVLSVGASITPASLGGTWSTPDGTGTFDGGTDFATATTYTPSAEDAQRGSVTLILTTNEPGGPCGEESAQVTFQILKVDCGTFPWNGGN